MKVIAISGLTSSGKGELTRQLQNVFSSKGVKVSCWGTSKPLKNTLVEYGVPLTLQNLQALGAFMTNEFGRQVLAQYLLRQAEQSKSDIAILEGVRQVPEAQWLMDNTDCLLVYVEAPLELRYQKFVERNQNPGDDQMTLEQFNQAGQAVTEREIPEIRPLAHMVLENDLRTISTITQFAETVANTILSKN